MSKNKFILPILFIAGLQVIISLGLGNNLNIGANPKTGKFGVWNQKNDMTIQKEIFINFQADEHIKKTGQKAKILGSNNLYEVIAKYTTTPISSFRLIKMILVLDLFLFFVAFLVTKSAAFVPSKIQLLWEQIYVFFTELVGDSLGKNRLNFTPYITTIFIFVLTANLMGIVPGLFEPTRNLNVPLGLGIVVIGVVHIMSIRVKGIGGYLRGYAEPLAFLLPLNIIGEASKLVSISFRLFGNILGGAIICVVISNLTHFVIFPIFLLGFFGIFIGTIQAFVFTMLSLSYLSAEIVED